jgi:hypothetical protein
MDNQIRSTTQPQLESIKMKSKLSMLVAAALAAPSFAMAEAADAKKPKFCDKEYDMDSGIVTFTFGNGEVVTCDSNQIPEDTRKQLMLHGISQKVGDSFAGVKGNYAEGIGNAKDTVTQLLAGVWKAAREDDARPRLAELAEAIARIKQVPLEAATKAVEAGTEDQRKAWRSNAKVKAVIAQLRAEKAAAALEQAGEQTLDIAV